VKDHAEDGTRITALQVAELAALLSKLGSRHVTEDAIRSDIEAGAPTNSDGTMNIVHYAAWMLRVESSGG